MNDKRERMENSSTGGERGGDKEKDGCKDVIYCGNISNERKILSSRK